MKGRMIMKHGKYYTVKRMRFLQYLLERGFTPDSTVPDPTNVKYKWWIFENSEELEAAIEEYFIMIKQGA
jgi:hypothetical protein